jgi:hypothetical protein
LRILLKQIGILKMLLPKLGNGIVETCTNDVKVGVPQVLGNKIDPDFTTRRRNRCMLSFKAVTNGGS